MFDSKKTRQMRMANKNWDRCKAGYSPVSSMIQRGKKTTVVGEVETTCFCEEPKAPTMIYIPRFSAILCNENAE